jgi:histone-arginine methyltransferase CARM1
LILGGQVESFLMARDLYLKPNGTLYPCGGKLWFVPLEDKALWTETEIKVSLSERTPSS